jgi:hypothetical protein
LTSQFLEQDLGFYEAKNVRKVMVEMALEVEREMELFRVLGSNLEILWIAWVAGL